MDISMIRLLAYLHYNGDEQKATEAVSWALKGREDKSVMRTGKAALQNVSDAAWRVYDAYPSSDSNNENRSTRKGEADLQRIERMLNSGHSEEELIRCIEDEKSRGRWLRNFSSFLQNLSDMEDETGHQQESNATKEIWQ